MWKNGKFHLPKKIFRSTIKRDKDFSGKINIFPSIQRFAKEVSKDLISRKKL